MSTTTVRRASLATVLVVGLLAGAGAMPAQAAPRPVAAAAPAADPFDPAPAGANDWACKPSAAHPHPLVLVHGIGVTMAQNWAYLSPILRKAGYCVFALTYGRNPGLTLPGGLAPIEGSAAELDTFVTQVLAATGAERIDLLAHSEGTVVSQWWLRKVGGAGRTERFVALDALYDGTTLFGLTDVLDSLRALDPAQYARGNAAFSQLCAACTEVLRGSEFLATLYDDGTVAAAGVTYTNVMTRYDELVVPYTSGRIDSPQATNIVLQDLCPLNLDDHALVVLDPLVSRLVLNALDPLHPVAPSCGPVLGLGLGPISL